MWPAFEDQGGDTGSGQEDGEEEARGAGTGYDELGWDVSGDMEVVRVGGVLFRREVLGWRMEPS